MNSDFQRARNAHIRDTLRYIAWFEANGTVPAPAVRYGPVELPSPGDVRRFAAIHRLDAPVDDGRGRIHAAVCFGTLAYPVYAESVKAAVR